MILKERRAAPWSEWWGRFGALFFFFNDKWAFLNYNPN
jgi:hypothetical protein